MARGDARASGANDIEEQELSDDERDEIVDDLIEDMGELFHGFVGGSVSFEDLTFEMYDTLRTLSALASGDVVIEYEDEFDEFDELAGEPTDLGNSQPRHERETGRTPSRPGHKPRGNQ